MGEMASLWRYEQNHDMDQLGQKLLFTTLELEKLKAEAVDEMRKNNEYTKQLIQMLKYAVQDRNEARNQIHKLLNKINSSFPTTLFQDDNPFLKPGLANSSITESNSPSDTCNYHSHCSSPVVSLFEDLSSSGLPSVSLLANHPRAEEVDQWSSTIDTYVKDGALPEKGKFLLAVLQAGPMLQTLLVAGPLPRWRNPPQFQPLQIPPLSITGSDAVGFSQKQDPNRHPHHGQAYGHLSCGTAQVQTAASMFKVSNLGSGTSLGNASGMNCCGYDPSSKRQRFF